MFEDGFPAFSQGLGYVCSLEANMFFFSPRKFPWGQKFMSCQTVDPEVVAKMDEAPCLEVAARMRLSCFLMIIHESYKDPLLRESCTNCVYILICIHTLWIYVYYTFKYTHTYLRI